MTRRAAIHSVPVVLALALALGCGDAGTEPRGVPGITLVAGAGATDTVQSNAPRLTVEVRGASGALVGAGESVEFTVGGAATALARGAYVCAQATSVCGDAKYATATSDSYVAVPADANGRASATVRLGSVAGPTYVYVTVPQLRLRDSVRIVVAPGNVSAIVGAPEDTAVVLGATFAAAGTAVDRFGNRRTDAVTLVSTTAGLLASGSAITATAYGPQELHFAVGAVTRTVGVGVIPAGQLVAGRYPAGLFVMNSDGSGRREIAMPAGVQQLYPVGAPAWRGADVLYQGTSTAVGSRIYVADAAGASRRLIASSNTVGETLPHANAAGDVFYFATDVGATRGTLRVLRAATGTSELVLAQGAPISGFDYAVQTAGPDVATLDFDGSNGQAIFLSRAGGPLTMTDQRAVALSYSPDGTQIAFINNGRTSLLVMKADGTGARVVATHAPAGQSYDGIEWTADGRWLLVGHPYNLPGGDLVRREELVEVATGVTVVLPHTRDLERAAWRR